jgi:hypothetical protein
MLYPLSYEGRAPSLPDEIFEGPSRPAINS